MTKPTPQSFINYRRSINEDIGKGLIEPFGVDIISRAILDGQRFEVEYRTNIALKSDPNNFTKDLIKKINSEEDMRYFINCLSTDTAVELYKTLFSGSFSSALNRSDKNKGLNIPRFHKLLFNKMQEHVGAFWIQYNDINLVVEYMFDAYAIQVLDNKTRLLAFNNTLSQVLESAKRYQNESACLPKEAMHKLLSETRMKDRLGSLIRGSIKLDYAPKIDNELKMRALILNHYFIEEHLDKSGDDCFINISVSHDIFDSELFSETDPVLRSEFMKSIITSLEFLDDKLSERADVVKKWIGKDMAIIYLEGFINTINQEFVPHDLRKSLETKVLRTFIGMREFESLVESSACESAIAEIKDRVDWSAIIPTLKSKDIENLKRTGIENTYYSPHLEKKQRRHSFESDLGL